MLSCPKILTPSVPPRPPHRAVCYSNCSCPEGGYNPVCGSDGVEYVSPCNAGCTNFTRHPNNTFKVQVSPPSGH